MVNVSVATVLSRSAMSLVDRVFDVRVVGIPIGASRCKRLAWHLAGCERAWFATGLWNVLSLKGEGATGRSDDLAECSRSVRLDRL